MSNTNSNVSVREEDAIRLIIEFLSKRDLSITQLSLERESGIYNCNFGDDLIFLRQLILDGQWDDALQFVTPLQSFETFSSQQFRFIIYKHKYVELLCIRSEAGSPSQTVEIGVQDIIDCLNQLENCCPNRDEYNRLSGLLTIPNLSDEQELRNWNPNSWRLKCFFDLLPLVEKLMQPNVSNGKNRSIAKNDRLMNLIFKGLMYELCLDSVNRKLTFSNQSIEPDVMNGIDDGYNLHCFIQSLPQDLFETYFTGSNREQPANLDIEKHDKPILVASWSEMILSTPIKPNVFPHTSVPYTRIKAADLMSKSLSNSLMQNASTKDLMTMSVIDIGQFSRSTLASTGFHLNNEPDCNDKENRLDSDNVMTASVDRLFKGNDVFSTSKGLIGDNGDLCCGMPTINEGSTPTDSHKDEDFTEQYSMQAPSVRNEVDDGEMSSSYLDIWMRHQKGKMNKLIDTVGRGNGSSSTTAATSSSIESRTVRRKAPIASMGRSSIIPSSTAVHIGYTDSLSSGSTNSIRPISEKPFEGHVSNNIQATPMNMKHTNHMSQAINTPKAPSHSSNMNSGRGHQSSSSKSSFNNDEQHSLWISPIEKSRFNAKVVDNHLEGTYHPQKHGPRSSTLSSPTPSSHSSHHHQPPFDHVPGDIAENDVRFVEIAKFDDPQAIRTAEFHPNGKYFAIGSNSKLLRVFQYSSQDSNNNTADSISDFPPPDLIYKRPKYHKGSIYCLTWNKLGNLLATGSNDKTIKLIAFDQESHTFHNHSEVELSVHDGTIRDLCFMDDLTNGSSLLLSGGAGDCKINITDCETSTPFLSLSGHSGPILSLYTWGGAMFVSGSQDRTIRFWDLRSNSCINFVTCPTISRTKPGGAVASISVDPTGKLLVSGHEDSTCMLYDIRGGRVIQTFHPHASDVRSVRFSSKAYYLLSGGYDNKIVLTDLQGDLTQPLKSVVVASHQDKVIQCRWHPTEFTFISTSADKSATIWALPD